MSDLHIKKVLFYQHFGKKGVVRGAHHKTFDFYHHIKAFTDYEPHIFFDKDSLWDVDIPWFHLFDSMPTLNQLDFEPDILFLNSGKDWIKYTKNRSIPDDVPIVSPVNNFRAVKPGHKSFDFLLTKAIRLCPSQELYEATVNHPNTNGKTIYLPNGVGITDEAEKLQSNKKFDLLIVGNKNPSLAQEINQQIKHLNLAVEVIDGWISKETFQNKLAESRISMHLPKMVEEHYIPGVEAMMLDSLVIIPDCVGNRSYSQHMETCFVTTYDLSGMLEALNQVLAMDEITRAKLRSNAAEHAKMFRLEHESKTLLEVLNSTASMWQTH